MKKILMTICMVAMTVATFAQEVDKATVQKQADAAAAAQAGLKGADTGEKDWKFSGVVGLNAAATGLVNWTAGGNNNVNGVAYGRFRLLYHKNNFAWDTNLDMEYGMSWIDQEYDKFQKSSDKLNFTTKFGWEFAKTWYLTGLAGFNSQFAYGRKYPGDGSFNTMTSKFLAPAYVDISLGIDWKPNDIFSVYLSPLAGRITTVYVSDNTNQKYLDEYNAANGTSLTLADMNLAEDLKKTYGVYSWKEVEPKTDPATFVQTYDKNARAEFGLSFKGNINYAYKDFKIQTSLGLFTPYAWNKTVVGTRYDGKDLYFDNNRRFGNFDVDWDTALSYQFFNCLQVTLSTSLKYYNGVMIADKNGDAKERVQFKGILGVGVGYSF